MTLTAITKDWQFLNPSVMLNQGRDRSKLIELVRKQQDELYCPHCFYKTGELVRVHFRNSETKRPHFFHINEHNDVIKCSTFYGETEKHLAAKVAVSNALKVDGLSEVKLEVQLLINAGLPWRRPDILVIYPNTTTEVHEIQISYINSLELSNRTFDLLHEVDRVIWYLYGKNYNQENRLWCHTNGIECYHLWFDANDIAKPGWKKDQGLFIKNQYIINLKAGADICNRNKVSYLWKPQLNEVVHKRYNLGWIGRVASIINDSTVEVIWSLDKYPTHIPVSDLRPQNIPFTGYQAQQK